MPHARARPCSGTRRAEIEGRAALFRNMRALFCGRLWCSGTKRACYCLLLPVFRSDLLPCFAHCLRATFCGGGVHGAMPKRRARAPSRKTEPGQAQITPTAVGWHQSDVWRPRRARLASATSTTSSHLRLAGHRNRPATLSTTDPPVPPCHRYRATDQRNRDTDLCRPRPLRLSGARCDGACTKGIAENTRVRISLPPGARVFSPSYK